MNAVDFWLILSSVLFGLGVLLSVVPATNQRINSVTLISGGLLTYMVSILVARN